MAIVPRNKFIEREAYKNSKSLQLILMVPIIVNKFNLVKKLLSEFMIARPKK